jgi:murein DD-endopeptidase MepM/ murein hydrolase activator NlpD
MIGRSIFQSKRLSAFSVSVFLVAGVSLFSLVPVGTEQATVSALEAGSNVATRGNWRGASFPVENFQGYTSPFGYRRSPDGASEQEFHRGLDMAAPQGSYIRNWWSGKVVEVSDHTACGTSVVVKSGEWEHIYCHMEGSVETANGKKSMRDRSGGVQIFEGQAVPAGTRIGRIGMTGRTTGPHLHWGLKFSGQYVDPALVLRAMYAEQAKYSAVPERSQ